MMGSLRTILIARLPALYAWMLDIAERLFPDRGEPELRLVPTLCHPDELAIDVGANQGTYAVVMVRHAGSIVAAEPNPRLARILRRRLDGAVRAGKASILEAALSDSDRAIDLFVPDDAPALASLEVRPDGAVGRPIRVTRRRIDELGLPRTGFIKIDVEGHEVSVIEGAHRLIERDRPNILVEAENRHHAGSLDRIRALLLPLGYRGFFLLEGRLEPIGRFDASIHQARDALNAAGTYRMKGRTYINNFIFSAREEVIRSLQASCAPPCATTASQPG